MVEYPEETRLKDGTPITLRPIEEGDFQGLVSFFQSLPEEDRLYLKEDVADTKVIRKWVDHIDPLHIRALLALHGDRIIGDATLHVGRRGWSRHLGEIRCVVAREYQRKGLGSVMAYHLLQEAKHRRLKVIKTELMSNQIGAIKAFSRIGFERSALLRGHAVDLTGKQRDLVIMSSDTDQAWNKMEDLILGMDLRVRR
jgi:RimJ/RimL family protein N-acetyltransferase